MTVDEAREALAEARATLVLCDDLLTEVEAERSRLRARRDMAALAVDIAEGELVAVELADMGTNHVNGSEA